MQTSLAPSPLASSLPPVYSFASPTTTADLQTGASLSSSVAAAALATPAHVPVVPLPAPYTGPFPVVPTPSGRDGLSVLANQTRIGDYEEAFTTALNNSDLELLTWVSYMVTSHKVLPGVVARGLSPVIQLCLVQQLSQVLHTHSLLKLAWLDVLLSRDCLNRDNDVVAAHLPGILEGVRANLEGLSDSGVAYNAPLLARVLLHAQN